MSSNLNYSEKVQVQQKNIDELKETLQSVSRQLVELELESKKKDSIIKEYEDAIEDIRERLRHRSDECERCLNI